jgi:hypothetical protein
MAKRGSQLLRWSPVERMISVVADGPFQWILSTGARVNLVSVKKHGNKWVTVAAMVLGGRTNKSCRERWVNYLDPDRASNTAEEERNDGNDDAFDSVAV